MNSIRNIHFTLLIRLNKRLHEFNFRQRSDTLFDVDTSDDRSNRFYFKIVRDDVGLKLDGKDIPNWIADNEHAIIRALQEKTAPGII